MSSVIRSNYIKPDFLIGSNHSSNTFWLLFVPVSGFVSGFFQGDGASYAYMLMRPYGQRGQSIFSYEVRLVSAIVRPNKPAFYPVLFLCLHRWTVQSHLHASRHWSLL